MAKNIDKWTALQREYLTDCIKNEISVKDWCNKKGLNFATAKRYIKKPTTVLKQAEKCESANPEKEIKSITSAKNCETNCENESETAKSAKVAKGIAKPTAKIVEGRPIIHGGYARYFKDKSAFDVVVDFSLKDEIDLMRQRAVSAIESIEKYNALLEKAETAGDKEIYAKLIRSSENALDRAVSRIESLNGTDSAIADTKSKIEYRKVQTQKALAEIDRITAELAVKAGAGKKVEYIQDY